MPFVPFGLLEVPLAGSAARRAGGFVGCAGRGLDFFFTMEAPCVVVRPLLEFFGCVLGWRWLAPLGLESWLTCRFSWPSSEFNFLVLDSIFGG